jgi:sialate O-acetylesterase
LTLASLTKVHEFPIDGGFEFLWTEAMKRLRLLPIFFVCFISYVTRADVRLPALFSDNMVLQQGMDLPVWGWADEGEEVKVSFRGKTAKVKAKGGKWTVKLGKFKAGGPDDLVVEGKNRIELKNVLVGEVWVCSGQSNMELALINAFEGKEEVARSSNGRLRLFHVARKRVNEPVDDVKAEWKESGPESTPGFSAVAYYFGRDLQKARNVPIGLIETCWGGSPAEVWMSEKALSSNPEYKRDILDAYSEGLKKSASTNARPPQWKPTELYNGMIAPLIPYAFKGAIWYQGESNAGRADQYRRLFADMIRNWRQDWGERDFTFLAVQLAPYDKQKRRPLEAIMEKPVDSDWAELREAQLLATKTLPNVGMAVITDVGEKDDIHPKKKEPVGARLALAARGIAYGEKLEYSGPVFKNMKVQDGKAILSFTHADSGLEARDGDLKGFAICGPDKKFVWGKAEVEGDIVIVSSPEVSEPVAVRYGWADFPDVNLWNKAGLPATPFRTDDFQMTTAAKKPVSNILR